MSTISPLAQKAIEEARRGEFEQALSTAKEAIARDPTDKGLRFFVGMLHSRCSQFEEAAIQLREALSLAPADPLVRTELVRVLGGIGKLDEAEELLNGPGLPEQESRRLRAMLAALRGNHEQAVALYRGLVGQDPRDFESWGNLGASLLASGDSKSALAALEQALRLRPGNRGFLDKWAEAHAAAGSADEALRMLYDQAAGDPGAMVIAARLEDLQERPGRAIDVLERALDRDPANSEALIALADLQERGNRIDGLEATLEKLQQAAPNAEKLPLLRARLAYRRGDVELALELAEEARPHVDPAARAQLLGQIHDRLGNFDTAFECFAEMNKIDALAAQDPMGKAERHLAILEDQAATLTPEWLNRWSAPTTEADREPAFLVGFPRSGTTLLDTMLMNEAEIAVSEENPMLSHVSERIGAFQRIADLRSEEVERLRDFYFEEAEKYVPECRGRLLVDKFPFGLGAAALIHRLFPRAMIIFLARDPRDVVLSCFMTRFQPTDIGSAFLTLEGTARLYDAMMRLWTRSRELFELQVHDARYESLVEDPKAEMRRLAEFLGIAWSDELVDNRPAAERRGFIKTPSYSQVSEPIYRRAVERWRNYSEQIGPALPILEPWISELGYET